MGNLIWCHRKVSDGKGVQSVKRQKFLEICIDQILRLGSQHLYSNNLWLPGHNLVAKDPCKFWATVDFWPHKSSTKGETWPTANLQAESADFIWWKERCCPFSGVITTVFPFHDGNVQAVDRWLHNICSKCGWIYPSLDNFLIICRKCNLKGSAEMAQSTISLWDGVR